MSLMWWVIWTLKKTGTKADHSIAPLPVTSLQLYTFIVGHYPLLLVLKPGFSPHKCLIQGNCSRHLFFTSSVLPHLLPTSSWKHLFVLSPPPLVPCAVLSPSTRGSCWAFQTMPKASQNVFPIMGYLFLFLTLQSLLRDALYKNPSVARIKSDVSIFFFLREHSKNSALLTGAL